MAQENKHKKTRRPKAKGPSRRKQHKGMCLEDRPALEPNAAGIDIGAREIYVAVPPDRDPHPVRVFHTFTEDLQAMAQWLKRCGITTAAMESTGVYWIPLYDVLEAHRIEPCLTHARHMKNVPGRRTDWHECQWLQYLHSVGLLRAAFRPDAEVCAVRAVLRQRQELVEMAGQHVQHMQKALTQMNLQIQHVISDITGTTGLAIIDAILDGERSPTVLARLRDPRIQASAETIQKSLVGTWQPEHLFVLRQSRLLFRTYQQEIVKCDQEIERRIGTFPPRVDPQQKPLPPDHKRHRNAQKKRKKQGRSENEFDLRTEAYKLFGVDATQVPGLEMSVLPLFSEVGRDLSHKWPTSAHFASWLGLCPDNDISGGRVLWKGTRRIQTRAGQIFRMAAYALHRSPTPLGSYLRRMKSKLGPRAATTATAHKIAVIFYTIVTKQVEYNESIWAQRDLHREKRLADKIKRQAQQLGYKLVPLEEKPAA